MAKTTTYRTVPGLNKALRQVPKEASVELRDEAQAIAGDIASRSAARALSIGGVAKYVAPTIKAKRDRVPVVKMGGSVRLPARHSAEAIGESGARRGPNQTVGSVWGGAEFGSKRHTQFRPWTGNQHTGTPGYFLYPTIRAMDQQIIERYSAALNRALQKVD